MIGESLRLRLRAVVAIVLVLAIGLAVSCLCLSIVGRDAPVSKAVDIGYEFLVENLWDEAKGAYHECPNGSSGLENNYWGDDNYLALIFHSDYERFRDLDKVKRIQRFLKENPLRLELGKGRWCVLSANNYTQYVLWNDWKHADWVALDGIYYARIGQTDQAKERLRCLIENTTADYLIRDEATLDSGHEYYKMALALILACYLEGENSEASKYVEGLTEKLLDLQGPDGSWLTDDKDLATTYPNTETTALILLALDFSLRAQAPDWYLYCLFVAAVVVAACIVVYVLLRHRRKSRK